MSCLWYPQSLKLPWLVFTGACGAAAILLMHKSPKSLVVCRTRVLRTRDETGKGVRSLTFSLYDPLQNPHRGTRFLVSEETCPVVLMMRVVRRLSQRGMKLLSKRKWLKINKYSDQTLLPEFLRNMFPYIPEQSQQVRWRYQRRRKLSLTGRGCRWRWSRHMFPLTKDSSENCYQRI